MTSTPASLTSGPWPAAHIAAAPAPPQQRPRARAHAALHFRLSVNQSRSCAPTISTTRTAPPRTSHVSYSASTGNFCPRTTARACMYLSPTASSATPGAQLPPSAATAKTKRRTTWTTTRCLGSEGTSRQRLAAAASAPARPRPPPQRRSTRPHGSPARAADWAPCCSASTATATYRRSRDATSLARTTSTSSAAATAGMCLSGTRRLGGCSS
mmetsp:Transcript_27838/g.82565  ORF Transcript_27838/g.82565 Transcript_27838/m.82565 type:complete len:213 (+) Transcript_27838:717-1355(+)